MKTMPVVEKRHPYDALIRTDRLPHIWCPGCGLGEIAKAYSQAVLLSGDRVDDHAIVSGIGCSGRMAGYINLDSYHTTHGRAIAFATGLKIANNNLKVTVISGDGDLSTIGGNHLIHAARRNIDITVILVNNFIYGMTGGQYSATTPHKARSSTSIQGNFERPFILPELMKAAGATYIARWTTMHIKQIEQSILKAFKHKGFSFIEVISPCPTSFGKFNKKWRNPIDYMHFYEEASDLEKTPTHQELAIDLNARTNIEVGEFYAKDDPSYDEVKLSFLKR